MNIKVDKNNVTIVPETLNKGEYNVTDLQFQFSEEYTGLPKMAVFSNAFGTYETAITNNACIIPYEVLAKKGTLTIGVYGYTIENNVVTKRYSPTPVTIPINSGSYIPNASNPEQENPTAFEQFMEQLEGDIDDLNDDINVLGQSVADLQTNKQDKLTAGTGINIDANNVISTQGQANTIESISVNGTPQTIANKNVDISVPTKVSQLTNDSGFINKNADNLTYYELKVDTGHSIELSVNSDFVMTLNLKNSAGTTISTGSVDLPLESVVVDGTYDSTTKEVVLTLVNGNTIRFSVADLVSGLQAEITNENKLSSDLVDDTNHTNKFVTQGQIDKLSGIEANAQVNVIEQVQVDGEPLEINNKSVNIVGIAELQQENADLLAQIPTATATGTTLNVQDSSNLPIKDFTMLGNAKQQTYTGKNMLNVNASEAGGIDANGQETATAENWRASTYISVLPNTTYTLSKNTSGLFRIYEYDSDKNFISPRMEQSTSYKTFTTTANTYFVRWTVFISSITFDKVKALDLQLEQGSTATSYEPYTGGQPSPNPDYPQDIHVVTGDNTLNVVGKNLISNTQYGLAIDGNGLIIGNSNRNAYYCMVKPNTTYYISRGAIGSASYWYYAFTDVVPSPGVTALSFHNMGSVLLDSATSPNNAKYLCIFMGSGLSDNVMVAMSNDTTYEPYTEQTQLLSLGSIELAKIPDTDITDVMFKAVSSNNPLKPSYYDTLPSEAKASLTSGAWYKQGNIRKRIYNGEEDWSLNSSVGYSFYRSTKNIDLGTFLQKYCNYFEWTSAVYSSDDAPTPSLCCNSNNNNPMDIFKTDGTQGTTVSEWQSWLSEHNTIVYSILKTPTYTEITDTTLIAQLENVLKMHTNKNVTNAWIEPSGTNAQASLTLTYYRDLQTITDKIDSLEARVSLLE